VGSLRQSLIMAHTLRDCPTWTEVANPSWPSPVGQIKQLIAHQAVSSAARAFAKSTSISRSSATWV
jgi:hypothetical protein